MIEEYNPWWRGGQYLAEDEDYRKWSESRIRWYPSLMREIDLKPYSLHFIFGPRQVGKTTLLKLLIKRLLDRGVDPRSILYLRCDAIADHRELLEVLGQYLALRDEWHVKNSYIFLDEVTYPREWYRALKLLVDMGKFRRDVLVVTGSTSMYVRAEVETFPGRRGYGRNFVMYPLSFREFATIVDAELQGKIEVYSSLTPGEVASKTLKMIPWLPRLNRYLKLYMECGGFPEAVKTYVEHGRIPARILDDLISWIKGELAKLRRNESIAKRILKAIVEKAPSPLSINSIAKEFEIRSHKTVFSYLDLFEKMYVTKTLHYIDPNRAVGIPYKNRKIHLTDPLLYRTIAGWCFTSKPQESIIVEGTVATHLSRRYEVGYWKNHREIDVVVKDDGRLLGVEVKYGEKPARALIKVGKMKNVIVLTKAKYNMNPPSIPISIFLACLP